MGRWDTPERRGGLARGWHAEPMSVHTPAVAEVIRTKGLAEADEPFQLASGEMSRYFVDVKRALADGRDLRLVSEAMVAAAEELGIDFDAVGGLTMGADQFAHGVALVADKEWFVVRKAPKGRGTNRLIEGAQLDPDSRVLLVEDTVTTGGSIQKAYEAVVAESGAQVVLALTVLDRGDVAAAYFEERDVPYHPLLTYRDVGIPAVGQEG